jgi:hypothetical protein
MNTIEPGGMLFSTTYLYYEDGKESEVLGTSGRPFQVTKRYPGYVDIFWLDTLEDDIMPRIDINRCVTIKNSK